MIVPINRSEGPRGRKRNLNVISLVSRVFLSALVARSPTWIMTMFTSDHPERMSVTLTIKVGNNPYGNPWSEKNALFLLSLMGIANVLPLKGLSPSSTARSPTSSSAMLWKSVS